MDSYRLLADLTVVVHLAFVLFAVAGGLLVLRWRRVVWLHVPAAVWAALIEFYGWLCPLTPLENWFRVRSGASGYRGGFVEHYILPVLYPRALTRELQIVLGIFVLAVNLSIYSWLLIRVAKARSLEKANAGGAEGSRR
ncbi:MAG: hypothetical protein AMS25_03360 [Gemmatimonas sp. SM23_52]|nr:MAG: hypothetical protein AMS25_03360 [Gemmatimonas sp. SM23_52]